MAEESAKQAEVVEADPPQCVIEELRQRVREGERPIWIPAGQTERIVGAMLAYYGEQYRLGRRAGVKRLVQVTREDILSGQCSVLGVPIEFEKDSRYDCSEMD